MLFKSIGFATLFFAAAAQADVFSECVSPNDDLIGRVPSDIRPNVIGEWLFLNADVVVVIDSKDQQTFTKKTCERRPYRTQGICVDFGKPSENEAYVYDAAKNALCSVGKNYDCFKIIGFHCGTGSRPDNIWIKSDTENRFPGTGSASSGYRLTRP